MKIVVNRCHGGFGLSKAGEEYYAKQKGKEFELLFTQRDDPVLIHVVERLGKKASDELAQLEIIEIPDGIKWYFTENHGYETIHEEHRSW